MLTPKERLEFCHAKAASFARLASKATSVATKVKFLELERSWIHKAQQKIEAGGLDR